ncbi:hypothetical protein [Winogradskya consettensis]
MVGGAAALAELVRPAGAVDDGGTQRILPVPPALGNLLPWRGLRRGSTVAVGGAGEREWAGRVPVPASPVQALGGVGRWVGEVSGSGGASLLLALLSAASRAGSWCAVVGVPSLGALAAAESGIALDRLAFVPNPGPEWPTVVAALIDGVDVVVLAAPGRVSAGVAGRLAARARQRGCVLVPYGSWDGADVTLQVTQGRWEGLGEGHGRLRRRKVTVVARGRGAAGRPKELTMWMPAMASGVARIPPPNHAKPAAVGVPAAAATNPTAVPAATNPTAVPAATNPAAVPTAIKQAGVPAKAMGAALSVVGTA